MLLVVQFLATSVGASILEHYSATMVSSIVNGCCDFIAQSILVSAINYACHLFYLS